MNAIEQQVDSVYGPFTAAGRSTVWALCQKYGPQLGLTGVDGSLLLWAIVGNESSFGANGGFRHEPSYCTGAESKSPLMIALTEAFAHGAHCSFGPWQLMLANALVGTSPVDMNDPEIACQQTVRFLKFEIVRRGVGMTLAQWGQFWNGGHVGSDVLPDGSANAGVLAYCAELAVNYQVPVPQA